MNICDVCPWSGGCTTQELCNATQTSLSLGASRLAFAIEDEILSMDFVEGKE